MAELKRPEILDEYVYQLIHIKARQLLRHRDFNRSDEDDLVQELTLGLWKRIARFDPARASFHTYAARIVDSCAASIVRERRRLKRAAGLHALSLESTIVQPGRTSIRLADLVGDQDLNRRTGTTPEHKPSTLDVTWALEGLSTELRDLCRRLMSGTPASVARDLGVSRRRVRSAIARIRRHFEKAGLADF